MTLQLKFESVMDLLNLDMRQKYGNYTCPFCDEESFTVYPDQKAYCHTKSCQWSGNALQLFCDIEKVSIHDAYKSLSIALDKKFIQPVEQTYGEAKASLAKDLEFLAWVRMYLAFYDRPAITGRAMLQKKAGLSKGEFSKVINGRVGNGLTWRKTLAVLRSEIHMDKFKKDLKLEEKFFERLLEDEKQGRVIRKYQIKKSRKPSAKTKSEAMKDLLKGKK